MTHPLVDEAEALQRAYRRKRMIWARRIKRPYAEDIETPEPAVLDGADPENG